jgi:FtsX extracellular domain
MNKKIILITAISTMAIVIITFTSFKAVSYLRLKNDCIKSNTRQNGYSVSINFGLNTLQADIDKFAGNIREMAGVQNVAVKTKDEALQEFKNEQGSNPDILKEVDQIGFNPFSSSITVDSNINNIDAFQKLEKNILGEAENAGLAITSHQDGNLTFLQEQLAKVKNASVDKDLFSYIFSGEGNHFFEKKYSPICNPEFSKNFPLNSN